MRKLTSDIKRSTKKYERAKAEYEKARAALQTLTDLKEVERLDEEDVKPNLRNVRQYGEYLSGVRAAVGKILRDYFSLPDGRALSGRDDRLALDAVLRLASESKLSADRWINEDISIMIEAVEKDKKGKATKYKASFYVERTIKQKI